MFFIVRFRATAALIRAAFLLFPFLLPLHTPRIANSGRRASIFLSSPSSREITLALLTSRVSNLARESRYLAFSKFVIRAAITWPRVMFSPPVGEARVIFELIGKNIARHAKFRGTTTRIMIFGRSLESRLRITLNHRARRRRAITHP